MSHIARIEIEIRDLQALREACGQLGFIFCDYQNRYRWWGKYEGDYPLPEGISEEQLGKCDHAIQVPGADYEIGVVKHGGKYVLLWDFYSSGGLDRVLGTNAAPLKRAYAIAATTRQAKSRGYQVLQKKTQAGLRLVLTKS